MTAEDVAGACKHCGYTRTLHCDEHAGLCCDCFDLSWGMDLDDLNKERAARDAPPITKPWPVRERTP